MFKLIMAGNKYNCEIRNKIIEDHKAGLSQICISKRYKIHKSTISRIISNFKKKGTTNIDHLGGRPSKVSEKNERRIVRLIKKKPFLPSKKIVDQLDLNIHPSTVRRIAIKNNLRAYRPAKKPLLRAKHRKAR